MILETIETGGLAHLSYLLGDEGAGVCAVIDPRRDVSVYLDVARANNCRITHILETHIHADFVSGSRELASQVGAPVYVGAAEGYGFDHRPLKDGDCLEVGSLRLGVLQTPGHTPEHVCYLVSGGKGSQEPWGLFTGDTLFAGEVGRPDLIGGGSEERLARQLFRTLHEKVLVVGDEAEIYPAHGAGSPCGGNIGDRRTSTIGYERRHNPKLQTHGEDEFVLQVLSDLPPAPFYYPRTKEINAAGPRVLGCLPNLQPLNPQRLQEAMGKPDVVLVDTRAIEAFGGAHLPGALNIALRDEFPIWAGWMLDPEQQVILVLAEEEDVDEVQRHLLRVGIENVGGFLRQGIRSWVEAGLPFERTVQMSVHELKQRIADQRDNLQVLDVRRDDEWEQGHVPGAIHIFAPYLRDRLAGLDRAKPVATYCGSGYRSSIAASLLQRGGFREVFNVPGSMKAWKAAGYPLEDVEKGA
jgi:hydroxyacylglutathione hydrolase